ncbi:MAG: hypothetical protein Q8N23_20020 [Archangium sp.]|nr:hypothetical protein [Archangium sp.]MDP3154976.1 hypothetical protein [Archangium sp.]MDP3569827.1 hypothetical protein [Archangium sp.]
MRTWLCCVLALASGCIVPRSMTMGQMAAPVGRGATDVGVHTGFIYASQTNPQFPGQDGIGDPIKTNERTAGFTIPAFEANINTGFNEHVALNVHASSAGLQPGLKLTLNKSKVAHVALMPQVAFGYASLGASTFVAGEDGVLVETAPRSQTSFTFLGGLKFLFSHRSGFYAGVGYDFIFNRNYNAAIVGATGVTEKSEIINTTTGHQIAASVGLDITLGMVHLRPEIAFAVTPGIAQSITRRQGTDDITVGPQSGGGGWAIFPGFTIAIVTPRRELTAQEEEEEEEAAIEAKKKKKRGGDEEEEEDDEDEPKRPAGRKKPRLDDDEEEENARKKRRPAVDEDD